MNKVTLFISVVTALMTISCAVEPDQPVKAPQTKLGVSLEEVQSKTHLAPEGTDQEKVRKVLWSEGDMINVNGSVSQPLTAQQSGGTTAEFSFNCAMSEYNVVYPASVCADREYSADGTITIEIPSIQKYSPTSFGNGAAILYGYASEGSSVNLQNLCGAVRVTLTGAATVKSAIMVSTDVTEPVAGTFNLNPRTGELSVIEGGKSVSLEIEAVEVDQNGQSFYFTLPRGVYPGGLSFQFYAADDSVMECRWVDNTPTTEASEIVIDAGKLYQFDPVTYEAGSKSLMNAEDWEFVAQAINAGTTDWKALYLDPVTKSIKIGADIVLPESATVINELSYTLDGCGYSITRSLAAPLVKTLKKEGAIKNLTIKGEATKSVSVEGSVTPVVPFVDVLDGGTLESCMNKMNISIASCSYDAAFAGFVNKAKGGAITGCINEGNISLVTTGQNADKIAYGGGIVASVFELTCPLQITECQNKGSIYLKSEFDSNASAPGVKDVGVGGIIGRIHAGNSENYVRIFKCSNASRLELDCSASSTKSASYQYSLGGIVGLSATLESSILANPLAAGCYYLEIEDCVNSADLYNNSISRCGSHDIQKKVYTGGIAGAVFGQKEKHAVLKNCSDSGDIIPYIGPFVRQAFPAVCGGMVGIGGYIDVTGGKVEATIGTDKAFTYALAGVIGTALTTFTISGVEVTVDILKVDTSSSSYSVGNHALAVTCYEKIGAAWKSVSGSKVEKCKFAGSYTVTTGTYSSNSLTVPASGESIAVTIDNFRSLIVAEKSGTDISVAEDNVFISK